MTETKVSAYNHSGEAELLLLALMWSSSDQGAAQQGKGR